MRLLRERHRCVYRTGRGPTRVALTGYHRATDNPVHTTVWPDSRIYSYASFDRARAYGLEARVDVPTAARYGVTGYLNYAVGRVHFYNPVSGGFFTEASHIDETNRFLAPMDQTHTLTGGATYRHASTRLWLGSTIEYGSGTPMGHGAADHDHTGDDAGHEHVSATDGAVRVPGHFTANLSFGVDLWRDARRARLSLRFDVENVANNIYVIAGGRVLAGAVFNPTSSVGDGQVPLLTRDGVHGPVMLVGV